MPGRRRRGPPRRASPVLAGTGQPGGSLPPDTLAGWSQAVHDALSGYGHDITWTLTELAHTGVCASCGGQIVIRRPLAGGEVRAFPAGNVLAGRNGWRRCKGPL